jgi:RNA polymerase sigma-70 factor (ECF subfamily)
MKAERDRFWKLLEPEYHRSMMFCRKLIGDRERGDDLFQDALVIACTRLSDLRDETSFRPWLYRIIVSTFRTTVRRPWWWRKKPLTSEMEVNLTGRDPTAVLAARRWLDRAFEAVSTEDQALVALHELEGWPVIELSQLLGKTEGAIKAQLFRARRKMKMALLKQARLKRTQNSAQMREVRKACTAVKSGIE